MARQLVTFVLALMAAAVARQSGGAIGEARMENGGESGQAMVEYALILGLVAAVVALALPDLGTAVSDLLAPVAGWL